MKSLTSRSSSSSLVLVMALLLFVGPLAPRTAMAGFLVEDASSSNHPNNNNNNNGEQRPGRRRTTTNNGKPPATNKVRGGPQGEQQQDHQDQQQPFIRYLKRDDQEYNPDAHHILRRLLPEGHTGQVIHDSYIVLVDVPPEVVNVTEFIMGYQELYNIQITSVFSRTVTGFACLGLSLETFNLMVVDPTITLMEADFVMFLEQIDLVVDGEPPADIDAYIHQGGQPAAGGGEGGPVGINGAASMQGEDTPTTTTTTWKQGGGRGRKHRNKEDNGEGEEGEIVSLQVEHGEGEEEEPVAVVEFENELQGGNNNNAGTTTWGKSQSAPDITAGIYDASTKRQRRRQRNPDATTPDDEEDGTEVNQKPKERRRRQRPTAAPVPPPTPPPPPPPPPPVSNRQPVPPGIQKVRGGSTYTGSAKAFVIDTGLDLWHEDLNIHPSMWYSWFGWDYGFDENGHGTHVGGIIGAKDNDIGVVGVAAGVPLVPVKIFDGSGYGSTQGVIAGIDWVRAVANAGDVANLSLGVHGISDSLDNAVYWLAASGVLVSIAAGNEEEHTYWISPARVEHPNIATCSAVEANGALAWFSNYGEGVDVGEPGVDIPSTYNYNRYAHMSGTSMAAPHMAGIMLRTGTASCLSANGNVWNDRDSRTEPICAVP